MTRRVQGDDAIDFTNNTGADLSAGDMAAVGPIVGVVHEDTADGANGVLKIRGVYDLPKLDAAVIALGEKVAFDLSAGEVDDASITAASGDVTAFGIALEAKNATTSENIRVLLTPGAGTVN